jgi:hypothetical protein
MILLDRSSRAPGGLRPRRPHCRITAKPPLRTPTTDGLRRRGVQLVAVPSQGRRMPITRKRRKAAAAAPSCSSSPSTAPWQLIEGSNDLMVSVLGNLDEVSALGRAACTNRAWREAAAAKQTWLKASDTFPMLATLREQKWYSLADSPQQALRQLAAYAASLAPPVVVGPRKELEHFRAVSATEAVPEGCVLVTRAMLQKRGLLSRLSIPKVRIYDRGAYGACEEGFLLGGKDAVFCYLSQSAENRGLALAASLGRKNDTQYGFCSKWFTKWINDTEQRTQRQSIQSSQPRIDVRALASAHGNARGLLSYLLSQDVPHLESLVDDLEAKACSRCSEPVKEGYKHIILFAQDVITCKIRTKDFKSANCNKNKYRTQQNNIRPAVSAHNGIALKYKLVYDDLLPRESLPNLHRLPLLETTWMMCKQQYLIGIEVKTSSGVQISHHLSELTASSEQEVLVDYNRLAVKWQGPIHVPLVSMFLIRKADGSRLCLTTDNSEGNAYEDDYGCGTTLCNTFAVAGTGGNDNAAKLCNSIQIVVNLEVTTNRFRGGGTISNLQVKLNVPDYDWDAWLVDSVSDFMDIVESPAFASRWTPPPSCCRSLGAPLRVTSADKETHKGKMSPCAVLPRHEITCPHLVFCAWTGGRAPSLLSVCLSYLTNFHDVVQAGQVSKEWYGAAKHETAWARVMKKEPTLRLLRNKKPTYLLACKQVFAQKVVADQVSRVPLLLPNRSSYMVAVKILVNSREPYLHICGLPEHSLDADKQLVIARGDVVGSNDLSDVSTSYATFHTISMEVSLLRVRDSKRMHLATCEGQEGDPNVIYCESKSMRSEGSNSFHHTRAHIEVVLETKDWSEANETETITGFCVFVDNAEQHGDSEHPCVTNVEGLLQMVERPSYAYRWT